ncbi:RNA 2',3'-cyclic phosphodiesterase [Usitatibacter rugosus]|uniref:RNA 2',3'-cyclic phosphodiesterase n=1 Tax=Usitatibacter rugosus TaxID=2732067 RepID=A0A6M4H0Q8_9PROT|nr:RNA 2',3'-cyclic phosphodiesterase [Usitatibacter rugosus]QJR13081.1 RNA 2',3'-cyclic phosphodiesterase [Usitatibacter rugosus]
MARHFFALWPDAAAAAALAALARELAEQSGGKPVPREKIHLTLAFLGEIDPEAVERARGVAGAIRATAFEVRLDRTGSFRGARVGWAGCESPAPGLIDLAAQLGQALKDAGFVLEERPFAPHVTLARRIRSAVARTPIAPIPWRASALALVRSEAGRYETIGSWETR